MRAGVVAAVAIAAGLITAGCATPQPARNAASTSAAPTSATPGVCAGFALSLAGDGGGGMSAMAAEESFVHTDEGTGFPRTGWQETGRDDHGVTLTSGAATLHAVQVSDGTWFVDSGHQC